MCRKGATTLGPITSEIKMKQKVETTSVAAAQYRTPPATHSPTHQITHLFILSPAAHLPIDLPPIRQSVIYLPTHISIYPSTYMPICLSIQPHILPRIHIATHPSASIHSSFYVSMQPSLPPPHSLSHMSPPWEALGRSWEAGAGMRS